LTSKTDGIDKLGSNKSAPRKFEKLEGNNQQNILSGQPKDPQQKFHFDNERGSYPEASDKPQFKRRKIANQQITLQKHSSKSIFKVPEPPTNNNNKMMDIPKPGAQLVNGQY